MERDVDWEMFYLDCTPEQQAMLDILTAKILAGTATQVATLDQIDPDLESA